MKKRPVVVITGASRGIGAAASIGLANAGWDLVLNYVSNETAARAVARQCEAAGAKVALVQGDVAKEADVLRIFAACDAQFGRLDALVNNAGVVAPAQRLEQFSAERLKRIFDTNVIGSILCAREAIQRMSTKLGGAGGQILNISSIAARLGSPNEYIDYAASKAAIDTMTIGLSKEVADAGIRVNAIRPGIIDTDIHASGGEPGRVARISPMVPMQRPGTADEIAAAVVFFLAGGATYTTGALLDIGGGR